MGHRLIGRARKHGLMTFPLPGKPKPYLMAHRGNSAQCPENTLAAFRRAFEDGADILETDLHLTADGAFVCIHDATLDRTTNGSGAVADLTLDRIKTFSADNGKPGFAGERVPTLDETAALLPDDAVLALELKSDRFLDPATCRRLVADLDAEGVRTRTVVLSFSRDRLRAVQQVAPDIPTGFITLSHPLPTADAVLLGPLWPLLVLNPFYVRGAHRQGKVVCPLDVNPDARLSLYRWLGCDAVMTNDTSATARALGRR
jgi:glycerophosphoryl diester phosphodiesterase